MMCIQTRPFAAMEVSVQIKGIEMDWLWDRREKGREGERERGREGEKFVDDGERGLCKEKGKLKIMI